VPPEPPTPEPPAPPAVYRFEPFEWLLYRRAYADELRPSSAEYDRDGWRYLEATNADGERRTYRVEIGRWSDDAVEVFDDGITPPPPPPTSGTFEVTHWPAPGKTNITQWYGANPEYYGQWGLDGHEGIDIAMPKGSPIVAIADGVVSRTVDERKPKRDGGHNYGIHVRIKHAEGYESIYAHLDSRRVNEGDSVTGGQQIGSADSTGNSTGHHLHISIKRNGAFIDPTSMLMSVFPESL